MNYLPELITLFGVYHPILVNESQIITQIIYLGPFSKRSEVTELEIDYNMKWFYMTL